MEYHFSAVLAVFFINIAIRAEATLVRCIHMDNASVCCRLFVVRTVTAQITDLEKEEDNEELYGGGRR